MPTVTVVETFNGYFQIQERVAKRWPELATALEQAKRAEQEKKRVDDLVFKQTKSGYSYEDPEYVHLLAPARQELKDKQAQVSSLVRSRKYQDFKEREEKEDEVIHRFEMATMPTWGDLRGQLRQVLGPEPIDQCTDALHSPALDGDRVFGDPIDRPFAAPGDDGIGDEEIVVYERTWCQPATKRRGKVQVIEDDNLYDARAAAGAAYLSFVDLCA